MRLEVFHLTWGILICLIAGLVEPFAFAGAIIMGCVLVITLISNGRELQAKATAEAIEQAEKRNVR